MYFQQRVDFGQTLTQVANITATTPRQEFRIPLQRTFPIEAIQVAISFQNTAVAASMNVDGFQAILNRINLTIADGVRTRSVVDVSGPSLLELQAQTRGFLDADTMNSLGNVLVASNNPASPTAGFVGASVSAFRKITYMLDCAPTQIMDPLSSMFLLPVTRYPSDPVLTLTIAGGNDLDKGAAPTIAISGITITVTVYRRFVNVDQWAYIDWDLTSQDTPLPSVVTDQRIELLTPGSYLGTLYQGYVGCSAVGAPLARYDVSQFGTPAVRIESLNVNFRRFTFSQLQALNGMSRGDQFYPGTSQKFFPGSAYNDFLTDRLTDATELGSVLDANIPVNSGATVNLYLSPGIATGGNLVQAGTFIRQVHYRAYGNLATLKGVR